MLLFSSFLLHAFIVKKCHYLFFLPYNLGYCNMCYSGFDFPNNMTFVDPKIEIPLLVGIFIVPWCIIDCLRDLYLVRTENIPKKQYLLPPDMHTYVCKR